MLGYNQKERQHNYCELFRSVTDKRVLEQIRTATIKGMVVGNDQFREEIEALTGRRVRAKKRGRPIGWRKSEK